MKRFRAILVMTLVAVSIVQAGYEYSVETLSTDGRGNSYKMVVDAKADGDKARFDFKEGAQGFMAGGYVLTRDGGNTYKFIKPSEKSYSTWDMGKLAGMLGNLAQMTGGMVEMKFSDVKVEKLSEEAGPRMQGMQTKHVALSSSYAMEMNVFGMRNKTSVVQQQDIWSTTDVEGGALGAWARGSLRKTGNAEFDKLVEAHVTKIQGFPLKVVVKSTQTSNAGSEQSTTTTEVKRFSQVEVAASLFDIPADYKETSLLEEAAGGADGLPVSDLMKMFQGR